jgi:hypothetical protein
MRICEYSEKYQPIIGGSPIVVKVVNMEKEGSKDPFFLIAVFSAFS